MFTHPLPHHLDDDDVHARHDCSVVHHLDNKAVRRRNNNILLLGDATQRVAQQHRLAARYSQLAG